jgi:hypothetical protein
MEKGVVVAHKTQAGHRKMGMPKFQRQSFLEGAVGQREWVGGW